MWYHHPDWEAEVSSTGVKKRKTSNRPKGESLNGRVSRRATAPGESLALNRFDSDRAIDLVMKLMAIPGPSGGEREVADFVRQRLLGAGVPQSLIKMDQAHRRTPLEGNTGNLILKLPGTRRAERRMLSAHMDTVPICVGCRPVRKGDRVSSADDTTGLGGDDRSGV